MDGRKNRPYRNLVTENHALEVSISRIDRLVRLSYLLGQKEQDFLTELKVCVEVACVEVVSFAKARKVQELGARGWGKRSDREESALFHVATQAIRQISGSYQRNDRNAG